MMEEEFYVYRHIRKDDGTVFYVGKGKDKRAWSTDRNRYWHRFTEKYEYEVEIVEGYMNEEAAFALEMELIKSYKEIGQCQTNLALGGEGANGYKWDDEQKQNQCQTMQKMWDKLSLEERRSRLEKTHKIWTDAEFREKIIKSIVESRKKFYKENPNFSTTDGRTEEEERERKEKIKTAHIGRDHNWGDKTAKTLRDQVKEKFRYMVWVTPAGIFRTCRAAASYHSVCYQTIRHRCSSKSKKWEEWYKDDIACEREKFFKKGQKYILNDVK